LSDPVLLHSIHIALLFSTSLLVEYLSTKYQGMAHDKSVTFSLSMAENRESSHSKTLEEMEKFDITYKAFVAFIS